MGGDFNPNIKDKLCDAEQCDIICTYGSLCEQIIREIKI